MINFIKETVTPGKWADLKTAVEAGTIKSRDLIHFNLKTGEEVAARATHDRNGKLFFVLEDCLEDDYEMNKRPTNKGGWAESDMRKHLNKTVFTLLPDELQALIKPTKVVQVLDGERVECEDKLFLLSRTQVFGKGDYSEYEPEDTQLDIFRTEKSRVKECADYGTWWWWLRSAYSQSSSSFCGVRTNGIDGGISDANGSNGVAFGFSI